MTSPIAAPPHIHALLARLHQTSLDQEAALKKDKASKRFVSTDADDGPAAFDALMRDKLIALDADKCHFAYQLVRAKGATTVVEAGTSFGVSTIYLALGVGRNARDLGEVGRVVATEKEGEKAAVARGYWRECGEEVEAYVDLREGDLLEMLREGVEDVDLLLLDIWTPLALPTLKLVQPKMRPGAVVLTDNTVTAAEGYKELLDYLRAPGSGFTNVTLPYEGGLEMSVYYPPQ
ncbi:S-adenosyl-L-methionine-dependent methyltransferase [Botryosphaeria dothidea]|uniref:S-adenosyl-L-methionine-dependent methyltransferase n=1 Tax=Botryosphaeria dothidea TaxID=55169 RepID=A0A8H4J3U8_9PEZI|nr:S-adenosyl-L-methionine-dependent methyltransferase [Botryosphaeria dothidea]